MLVKNFMTREIVAIQAEEKAGPALQLMRERGLRRMPVLNEDGQLVGVITDRRLLQALAVPVRRGEFRRSVEQPPELTVGALMAPEIFTTTPDTLLEEAAAEMAFHRVGSLIVMEDGKPIGIITETDMFRIFLRLLGGTERGLRVSLRAPSFRGIQADIITDIARAGGNLISLGNLTDDQGIMMAFKVVDMTRQDLEAVLEELPVDDVEIHEI